MRLSSCNISAQISTHAPRTGSDLFGFSDALRAFLFQPTLPARGATDLRLSSIPDTGISTHAPRTGSDNVGLQCRT